MDNGYGAQFMVLGHYIAHKFAVLYVLPHVLMSAIYIYIYSLQLEYVVLGNNWVNLCKSVGG